MSKMPTDAVSVAETLVRDCLETLVSRNRTHPQWNNRRIRAEAEAVIALASSLLAHLDAEAKQLRAATDGGRA